MAFVTTKEDPKPPHLVLPPRSSYQRLIAYRLSARFKLQKATPEQEKEAIAATEQGTGVERSTSANGENEGRGSRSESEVHMMNSQRILYIQDSPRAFASVCSY